ncbi:MAG TPA: pyruvate ferredoxin oxidoreductase, partial [Candidatus Paceibacterota bacterium]|nr:pyruvate ferredoxin oxidoreductase [Candidatus Paceibacterota bacterium]
MSTVVNEPSSAIPASSVAGPVQIQRRPLNKKELASEHPTWCPGCGDFSVLAIYLKLVEKRQLDQERLVSVSGIGCSSRFPYFVQAHGAHF